MPTTLSRPYLQIFCTQFYQYRTKNRESASSVSIRTSEKNGFRCTDVTERDAYPTVLRGVLNRVTLTSVKKCGKYARSLYVFSTIINWSAVNVILST